MNETLSAGDGDRFGDRCESKWTQLTTTQTAPQSLRTTQKHPNSRVVVPAAAGSSPVAHPSKVPANRDIAREADRPVLRDGDTTGTVSQEATAGTLADPGGDEP